MRPTAEPKPLAIFPVFEIVARLEPRTGSHVRDSGPLDTRRLSRKSLRLHKYISAASSSGASDQSGGGPCLPSAARWDTAREDTATRAPVKPGSARPRFRSSTSARLASAGAATSSDRGGDVGRGAAARALRSTASRGPFPRSECVPASSTRRHEKDCTPKLTRLTPAVHENRSFARYVEVSGLVSSVTSASLADGERISAGCDINRSISAGIEQ